MMSFDTISHHGPHLGTHGLHGHHGRTSLGSASSLAAAATGAGTAAVNLQPHHSGHDHVVTPPPAAFPSGPDPLPLGLAGFSSAVFLTSAHYAGFISSTGWLAPIGMIAGGLSSGWAGHLRRASVGQAVHHLRGLRGLVPHQQVCVLNILINSYMTDSPLALSHSYQRP